MTESPSALLERAAARLEALAEHFAGYDQAAQEEPTRVGSPVQWWVYDATDRHAPRTAKLWIEALNPSVASPLVEWLRDAARRMESHPHLSPEGSTMQRAALAFARIVLGEPE